MFRLMNRIYANIAGYFWLPCPVCGEPFGGHEAGAQAVKVSPGLGLVVCYKPECNEQALRRPMPFPTAAPPAQQPKAE